MYYDALRKAYIDAEDGSVVLHEEIPSGLFIPEASGRSVDSIRASAKESDVAPSSAMTSDSAVGSTYAKPPSSSQRYQPLVETDSTPGTALILDSPGEIELGAIRAASTGTETTLISPTEVAAAAAVDPSQPSASMHSSSTSNKGASPGGTERVQQLERDLYAIQLTINNGTEDVTVIGPAVTSTEDSALPPHERHIWDDWSFARTLQALEFELPDEVIDEHRDFNEKELRASKSCRRQLLTLSFFICLVQIGLLIAMIQDDGYAPENENPVIGPHAYTLVRYGAKETALIILENEWWRLLASIMLHGGIWHIIPNVAIQLRIGGYLNLVYGTPKFLFIYLISGIFGEMMSCIFLPEAVGVGSSGALLGLLASWLVWILFRWKKIPPECRGQRNCQLAVVVVAVAITLGTSFSPNVDWAAHFGGAVQGGLWGLVLLSNELDHHGNQFAVRVVAALVAIGALAFSLYYMLAVLNPPRDNLDYWEEHDDWGGR